MKKGYPVLIADPAKNITAFVLDESVPSADYIPLSRSLMEKQELMIEQVGFCKPSTMGAAARLEMMGGEFCGNASRSFGIYQAHKQGMCGQGAVTVEVSGSASPLEVLVDLEHHTASISMPLPTGLSQITLFASAPIPVILFDGIVHAIVLGTKDEMLVPCIIAAIDAQLGTPDAIGVMFLNPTMYTMTPAVYVRNTDSLIYESSCGSGSVAASVYLTQGHAAGKYHYEIEQPGGTLSVCIAWDGQWVQAAQLGGSVNLGEPFLYEWEPEN